MNVSPPRKIAFLLVPQFSLIAFSATIEPLRLASRVAGATLYEWTLHSLDGRPAQSSSGVCVDVDGDLAAVGAVDIAMICAGVDVEKQKLGDFVATVRSLAKRGVTLGAVCTGAYVLARARALEGRRTTIHWENHAALAAEFPELDISHELFEVDRDRMTCAGGLAAIDMTLSMISADHGQPLALKVSDQLIHARIRNPRERQRTSATQLSAEAPRKLVDALARMERRLNGSLDIDAFARSLGVSARHLERLFKAHFKLSPKRYHLKMRLERARAMLRQTELAISVVAFECGFASSSHFSTAYSATFGVRPSEDRRQSVAAPARGARKT